MTSHCDFNNRWKTGECTVRYVYDMESLQNDYDQNQLRNYRYILQICMLADRQTDRQTDRRTDRYDNITFWRGN